MELNEFIADYIRENHPHIKDFNSNYITDAIKAGYNFCKGHESIHNDGDDGISDVEYDNLYLLNKILGKANLIFNSKELGWDEKYDMIFSDKISSRVSRLFQWYDPDTTYEEDVTSFMRGFNEYIENRNKKSKYS